MFKGDFTSVILMTMTRKPNAELLLLVILWHTSLCYGGYVGMYDRNSRENNHKV